MKKVFTILGVSFFSVTCMAQNVGIGTTTAAASAQLDVSSTTKGLLPPRMTFTQRNAIETPVAGLMVWCTNCGGSGEMQVFNGTSWTNMIGGYATDTTLIIPICSEVWMVRNLDVNSYRNGDPIPNVTDPAVWPTLTTGAYCYYNNDSTTYAATYGKLYNWYAVNDPRGLAPIGWHLPTDSDLLDLSTCLGGDAVAGGVMKEIGTTHWSSPNGGATNYSGFTGLPGGYRDYNGSFGNIGTYGYWWSSSQSSTTVAGFCGLNYFNPFFQRSTQLKLYGYSVRCIKNL